MKVSSFIARRYLFARKSLGVINIISMISAAGIAIGCAALVIILSVYNGFDRLVRELNNSYTADVQILPSQGKSFVAGEAFDALRSDPRVRAFCEMAEENVFVKYGERTAVVTARGVDSLYAATTGLRDYVTEGSFELTFGALDQVVAGRTIALQLGARTTFITPLEVYFPSRSAQIDVLDPLASLRKRELYLGGVVSLEQAFDQKYIFMPVESLRSLLEFGPGEVSSVELYLDSAALDRKGMASKAVLSDVRKALGEGFVIKDKQQQNDMMYKILSYEKIAIYLILLFVIIIISSNIFSSLSMLVIEKKDDMETLQAMGASNALVRKVFVREGWMISLLGIAIGVILGLAVCLLQMKFALVKMPGNFIIDAYPVVIRWGDVALTIVSVAIVGYLAAALSRRIGR